MRPYSRPVRIYCAALLLFGLNGTYAATPEKHPLRLVDIPQPFCRGKIDLEVAREYFVEVANVVPGVVDYNRLMGLYRQREWQKLSEEMSVFDRTFETSPLREAVAFLRVQMMWEQSDGSENSTLGAEKAFREVLLLYPKSQLAPVLTTSIAGFWLKHRHPEKSLALYTSVKESYPKHELSCVFDAGMAEAHFLLGDLATAESDFKTVLKRCKNQRVRVGAMVRLADIQFQSDPSAAEKNYQKIYQDFSGVLYQYYSSALFNLGELKYRKREFPSAKFFFNEFTRMEKPDIECAPHGMKRMADIALHSNQNESDVSGLYLATREKYPMSDVGRFSHARALMMGMTEVDSNEHTRRIKLVDEEIEKITDPAFQRELYLEKGLMALQRRDARGLDYMKDLSEREPQLLKPPAVLAEIRRLVAAILTEKMNRRDLLGDDFTSSLAPYERAYKAWLVGSPYEEPVRKAYYSLIISEFDHYASHNDLKAAMGLLDHMKTSGIWKQASWNQVHSAGLLRSVVKPLLISDRAKGAAEYYQTKRAELSELLGDQSRFLLISVALRNGDKQQLQKAVDAVKSNRGIASIGQGLPKELVSTAQLVLASAQRELGNYKESAALLAKIEDKSLKPQVLSQQYQVFRSQRLYPKALDTGISLLKQTSAAEQPELLGSLREIAVTGKLWKSAPKLLSSAKQASMVGKELAPFHYFAGRAAFEQKNCSEAIDRYEEALGLDSENSESVEARFRVGKCWLGRKDRDKARKIWQEIAEARDPFWSPLAKNELKLLSK